MAAKKNFGVRKCDLDHTAISHLWTQHFHVEIHRAHHAEQALEQIRNKTCGLVLVNRKLDMDGSDGVNVIRSAFGCDNLSGMPFMLVSNYDDARNQAVATG